MSISKPVPVPTKKIGTIDITKVDAGLSQLGASLSPNNSFISSKDVEVDGQGFMEPRRNLVPFLPDTVEEGFQIFPVLVDEVLYYFTCDDGKVIYAQEGDLSWSDCTGSNTITTQNGGRPVFIRVLDTLLVCNGGNGDKLFEVDLTTPGFPVVKYTLVADPTAPLTDTLTNLSSGVFNQYYAYTYSSPTGETLLSPILTIPINIVRDQWGNAVATPSSIKLTLPGAPPAGATYWNLYTATSSTGGVIQPTDMLSMATRIDLATTSFIDDGTLGLNLGTLAPIANNTDGPRVTHGIIEDGTPILYGDVDVPYNIWIGGTFQGQLDFSIAGGGYLSQAELGTNFYPSVVVGFRTGQGLPSLTVLYSNTEGLSKQAVLAQQTVTYGDTTFSVWGITEQHYGAAGVAAPNSAVNSNGKLLFLSTNGFLSAETQPTVQNILSINSVSGAIREYVKSIKNSAMPSVVGCSWDNKFMWLSPAGGFDEPQQILILDTNVKGVDGAGAWETLDIPAQWIGVISPQDDAAFVYVVQGTSSYRLVDGNTTYDTKNGVPVPFSTNADGAMIAMEGQAHNQWQATIQCMFYILELIGEITIGVRYRDQNGDIKFKEKTIEGPVYTPSGAGGWGDPDWAYHGGPSWASSPKIDDGSGNVLSVDVRKAVEVDDIASEAQWYYRTPVGFNHYKIRAISFEGIDLGVRPDLQ